MAMLTQYPYSPEMAQRLERNFIYHAPKKDQLDRYDIIRNTAKTFAEVILTMTPPSREQLLALTALEEAMFWANAGVARNE